MPTTWQRWRTEKPLLTVCSGLTTGAMTLALLSPVFGGVPVASHRHLRLCRGHWNASGVHQLVSGSTTSRPPR